jgi:hypothetical protein
VLVRVLVVGRSHPFPSKLVALCEPSLTNFGSSLSFVRTIQSPLFLIASFAAATIAAGMPKDMPLANFFDIYPR